MVVTLVTLWTNSLTIISHDNYSSKIFLSATLSFADREDGFADFSSGEALIGFFVSIISLSDCSLKIVFTIRSSSEWKLIHASRPFGFSAAMAAFTKISIFSSSRLTTILRA